MNGSLVSVTQVLDIFTFDRISYYTKPYSNYVFLILNSDQ